MTGTKRCTKCGVVKQVDEFHRSTGRPDGRTPQCKACRNAARAVTMRKARGTPRGPTFPELHDPAWLKQRYMEEMLTPQEIADRIGCSAAAVNSAIRRAGIPRLPLGFRKVLRKKMQEVSA